MELPKHLQETIPDKNNSMGSFSDVMINEAVLKSLNSDSEPKVTVTIPKSQLDFLNMFFPKDQLNFTNTGTENKNEDDLLIATPFEKCVEPVKIQPCFMSDKITNLPINKQTDVIEPGLCNCQMTDLSTPMPVTHVVQQTKQVERNEDPKITTTGLPVTFEERHTSDIEHHSNIHVHESTFSNEASSDSLTTTCSTLSSDSTSQSLGDETVKSQIGKVATKPKQSRKPLTFPPCNVCGGKSSGLHYGVNSCEACKGFFRRYLLKKVEYKCNKNGKCEVINRSRGICSGCRLQKCFKLGMSKDRVQMGRYTSAKRTEAITFMNKLKTETSKNTGMPETFESHSNPTDTDECSELIDKLCCMTLDLNQSEGFSLSLVEELKQAASEIQPFGPDIVTDEEIELAIKSDYAQYKNMVELFGEMKPASHEEYFRLYKDYSIDVDGRMQELKDATKYIEQQATLYCKFAKHIPGFSKLPIKDQTNLLKAARIDVYVLLMHKGYCRELDMTLTHMGKAYHIDQYGDMFMSRDTCQNILDVYERWQNLKLSKEEVAILMALVLMCPDRCNLVKRNLAETMQQSLSELLMDWLRHTCANRAEASKRFAKMIDVVTFSQQPINMCHKEYKEICENPIFVQECPVLKELAAEYDQ